MRGNCGRKTILVAAHVSLSSCPWRAKRNHQLSGERGGAVPSLAYKEYVIYRALMDCYYHTVYMLECFIPATSDATSSTTHAAIHGVVADCYRTDVDGVPRVELELLPREEWGTQHVCAARRCRGRTVGPPICWYLPTWRSASGPLGSE
jgi:hypothetical protein